MTRIVTTAYRPVLAARRKAQEAEIIRTPPSAAQPTKEPTPLPMVSAVCKAE